MSDSPLAPANAGQNTGNVINQESIELLIIIVDVGQGESTILLERDADGKPVWCAIIDGGYSVAGRGALIRYLRAFGVDQVSLIVCTHFDGDHTKGLTDLLARHVTKTAGPPEKDKLRADSLLLRNTSDQQAKSSTKLKLLDAAKGRVALVQAEKEKVVSTPGARSIITCLYTNDQDLTDENEGSIALLVKFGTFRYYTAGDLPHHLENGILGRIGTIDAFKCGHHGSANSTPPELLTQCKPLVAFISSGQNSFGHPTFDVVERLASTNPEMRIQAFYLTNCIHNRRCINANYAAQEAGSILPAFEEELTATDAGAFAGAGTTYDQAKIAAAIQQVSAQLGVAPENEREALKKRRRTLRGMERSAQHEAAPIRTDVVLGRVAGSNAELGTIVTHVPHSTAPDPRFHVVFRAGVQQSFDHCRVAPPAADNHPYQAVLGGIYEKLGQVMREQVPGSPGNYADHIEKRTGGYRLFNLPTIVGLSTREGASVEDIFCAICVSDFPATDARFQFVGARMLDDDEYVPFHRICFASVLIEKLTVKGLDEELVDEDEAEEIIAEHEETKSDESRSVEIDDGLLTEVDLKDLEQVVIGGEKLEELNDQSGDWVGRIRDEFKRVAKGQRFGSDPGQQEAAPKEVARLEEALKKMELEPEEDEDSEYEEVPTTPTRRGKKPRKNETMVHDHDEDTDEEDQMADEEDEDLEDVGPQKHLKT